MAQDPRRVTEPASTPTAASHSTQYAFQHHAASTSSYPLSLSLAAAKAKRRRTSPQDHAVLEAAYLKNSKPDKVQRAQIVSSVSLGEKEVQIWFQNRRQNDRRRSKPLEPHELVAHLSHNITTPISRPQPICSPPDPPNASQPQLKASLAPTEPLHRPSSRASSIHDLLNPSSSDDVSPKQSTQETSRTCTPSSSFEQVDVPTKKDAPVVSLPTVPKAANEGIPEDGSEQGSARKRDHDEMAGVKPRSSSLEEPSKKDGAHTSKESIKRTSSFIRLAMTVDGAVKVSRNKDDTPSPEKPRPTPPIAQSKAKQSMMRSKSALNGVEVYRDSTAGSSSRSVGAGFGRSRDSRTWSFYCDSNSKDALSTQAEAETAGSAVSAINLIRSNSFKSRSQALSPSMTLTNVRPSLSKDGKTKLSRAKSSLGRLQGMSVPDESLNGKPKTAQGHARSPSDDSDKENWAPGTTTSDHALRRTHPSDRQRPILQENEEMTFPDAGPFRKQYDTEFKIEPSPTKDKAKDMDCVQGLLSLSQGAWTRT